MFSIKSIAFTYVTWGAFGRVANLVIPLSPILFSSSAILATAWAPAGSLATISCIATISKFLRMFAISFSSFELFVLPRSWMFQEAMVVCSNLKELLIRNFSVDNTSSTSLKLCLSKDEIFWSWRPLLHPKLKNKTVKEKRIYLKTISLWL